MAKIWTWAGWHSSALPHKWGNTVLTATVDMRRDMFDSGSFTNLLQGA